MSTIAQAIIAAAQAQGVDPALAIEVAQVESGMNQSAIGSHGEIGVFQLMPETAQQLGVDPTNLEQNIQGGVAYLRQLLSEFGDPTAAIAAYNWGPSNVSQAIAANGTDFSVSIPGTPTMPAWLAAAPASVRSYVNKVLGNVQTQYSVVAASTAAGAGVSPGGSTSTLAIPTGLVPGAPGPPPAGFSWGTAALVFGVIVGIGLVLEEI